MIGDHSGVYKEGRERNNQNCMKNRNYSFTYLLHSCMNKTLKHLALQYSQYNHAILGTYQPSYPSFPAAFDSNYPYFLHHIWPSSRTLRRIRNSSVKLPVYFQHVLIVGAQRVMWAKEVPVINNTVLVEIVLNLLNEQIVSFAKIGLGGVEPGIASATSRRRIRCVNSDHWACHGRAVQ